MSDRAYVWALSATGGLFLAMVILSGTIHCGGVWRHCSFDAQVVPYAPSAARAYLAALEAEGLQTYLWRLQPLDMIFPAALCVVLRDSFIRLAPERSAHLLGRLAVAEAGVDYLENALVRAMLKRPGGDFPDLIPVATSGLTALKWALVLLLLGTLAGIWTRRVATRR